MSLEILVNVKKCGTAGCNNMVPVGRLAPDKPRKCDGCKRLQQKAKWHFCIYCKNNIGTQKTRYCDIRCQRTFERLVRARKKVKSLKDQMLYQRRLNRMNRKRVYVLNNWDQVQQTKSRCRVNHTIRRQNEINEVLKE